MDRRIENPTADALSRVPQLNRTPVLPKFDAPPPESDNSLSNRLSSLPQAPKNFRISPLPEKIISRLSHWALHDLPKSPSPKAPPTQSIAPGDVGLSLSTCTSAQTTSSLTTSTPEVSTRSCQRLRKPSGGITSPNQTKGTTSSPRTSSKHTSVMWQRPLLRPGVQTLDTQHRESLASFYGDSSEDSTTQTQPPNANNLFPLLS